MLPINIFAVDSGAALTEVSRYKISVFVSITSAAVRHTLIGTIWLHRSQKLCMTGTAVQLLLCTTIWFLGMACRYLPT